VARPFAGGIGPLKTPVVPLMVGSGALRSSSLPPPVTDDLKLANVMLVGSLRGTVTAG
jgi:hypothetical protein